MSKQTTAERLAGISSVVVHPGVFHADEVCAVAYLRTLGLDVPVYRRIPTPEELATPRVLVVDVGGRHEPSLNNYDHHQRSGAGTRPDGGAPFAAFGLIAREFPYPDAAVAGRFGRMMVVPVDATDCGWGTHEGTRPDLSWSAVVSSFNPPAGSGAQERGVAFEAAVAVAARVVENFLIEAAEWVAAREVVLAAPTVAAGRVVVLPEFVPWSDHVYDHPRGGDLLYVLYPSERGGWCVQQVAKSAGAFEGRKPLPESWAGLRGEDLRAVAGLEASGDATFCHPGRFIAGAETEVDCLRLAVAAVEA